MPAGRPSRRETLILGGWILLLAVLRSGRLDETDPYWQIRAGQEVLDGTPLARPDTWSWDPVAGLFFPNSPAWNLLLAGGWQVAGFWSVFALSVLSIAAYLTTVAWLGRLLGARPVPTVLAMVALVVLVLPMLSLRATLVAQTLFLVAVGLALLWSRRAEGRPTWVNAAVVGLGGLAVSLLGNWIHLSWGTLAATTAVAWLVLWLLSPGLGGARRLLMTVTGSAGLLGGVLLGPYGLDALTRARAVFEACRGLILEWTTPFHPELVARWAPSALVTLVLTIAAAFWCARTLRVRRDDRTRLSSALTISALPYAVAGLIAIRFIGIAALTMAPVLAAGLSVGMTHAHAWAQGRATRPGLLARRLPEWTTDGYWAVVLGATLLVLAPFAVVYAWPHATPRAQALNAALPSGCRLFSTMNESAAVILTRPDVPIWIDGRADYWGRERLLQMEAFVYSGAAGRPVPDGTTCVLLPDPSIEAPFASLTAALDASPEWTRSASTGEYNLWLPAEQ